MLKYDKDHPEIQAHLEHWKIKKEKINQLADFVSSSKRHQKLVHRLKHCGQYHKGYELNGELKLLNIRHCRVRPCPECQQHRQRQLSWDFRNWIRPFLTTHPNLIYLVISIGFKNVTANELKTVNRQIHEGFQRLTRKTNTKLKVAGWLNSSEFTIKQGGFIHPNCHTIMAFDPQSFDVISLSKAYLTDLIQKRFRLENPPNLGDPHIINGSDFESLTTLVKTFTYAVKPQDYVPAPGLHIEHPEKLVVELIDALAHSRALRYGGLFRSFRKTASAINHEKQPAVVLLCARDEVIVKDLRKQK